MGESPRNTRAALFAFSCVVAASLLEIWKIGSESQYLKVLGILYMPWAVDFVLVRGTTLIGVLLGIWMAIVWLGLRKSSRIGSALLIAASGALTTWSAILLWQWSRALESVLSGTGFFN